MRKITAGLAPLCTTVAVGVLLAACQPAAPGASAAGGGGVAPTPVSFPSGAAAATTFTDPTEGAFSLSVPQGWTVKGGVQRVSAAVAQPWVTATSPDGATVIALGDPSVPPFVLPSQMHGAGQQVQTASGVMGLVEPYENGVQFAQDYASRSFANTCQLQPMGNQAEPGLAQMMQAAGLQLAAQVGITPQPAQIDGGSATFGCQVGGVADVVGVMDVTTLLQSAGGGSWSVPLLVAYRTPAASQAQTDQLARAMRGSMTTNPQWQAKMIAAARQGLNGIQQNGAAAQAALGQQEIGEQTMLNQHEAGLNGAIDANHDAFATEQQQQQADHDAGIAQQTQAQQTGQDAEMRDIQNQQCVQWYDAAHTRCAVTAPN
jgi:hypothetical protein